MSTQDDIMADFKSRRFIVAPQHLLDTRGENLVILTDYMFWSQHIDELTSWCNENNSSCSGMAVVMPDPETVTMFCLRWS